MYCGAMALAEVLVPGLASAADGDARWDFRFGLPGTDGTVYSASWFHGDLYIGGGFRLAGQARAISVARWDGTNYWPLGEGLEGDPSSAVSVYALAGFKEHLYAGGAFTHSGTNALPSLARWDGTNWSPVGDATGVVYSLTTAGEALWVTGAFHVPGDTNLYGLAKWDGANWLPDGRVTVSCTNCDPLIGSVAVNETNIFVAGTFSTLNGQIVSNQARSNGTNWVQISCSTNETVFSLAVHQGEVYACGAFSQIDGVAATNVVRWDGTNWWPLGSGLGDQCYRLLSAGTNLYALGDFANAGAVLTEKVARWDGSAWHGLGDSLWNVQSGDTPYILAADDTGWLFAGGYFQTIQGRPAANVAAWNESGSQWKTMTPASAFGTGGTIGLVRALATSAEAVYAGGFFEQAGQISALSIARFSDQGWSALGGGLPYGNFAQIRALAVQGSNLFVGGTFTNAGGLAATNLARGDGQDWWPVGGGLNSNVFALLVSDTNLYAGGNFTHAGNVAANRVACWDGAVWTPLGGGVNAGVQALSADQGRLFVGGTFTNAGGAPASCVAVWDGTGWQALGAGVASQAGEPSAQVSAIAVAGSNVYVGGRFTLAGGQPANNVARWNGTDWLPLGSGASNGVQGTVAALAVRGDQVFVGGYFTNAGGMPALSLARWDGTNWSTLGSGLEWSAANTPRVYALALRQNELWVGGLFSHAGLKPSANLARWMMEPMVRFSVPDHVAGDVWRLRATGVTGLRFRMEGTTNFIDWSTLTTGQGDGDAFEFMDAIPLRTRFYRVVLEP